MTDLAILTRLEAELARRERENRLKYYRPYAKQQEWHTLPTRERALIAGNQLGKTMAAGLIARTCGGLSAMASTRWRGGVGPRPDAGSTR